MAEHNLELPDVSGPFFYIHSLLNDLVLSIATSSSELVMLGKDTTPSPKQLWYEDTNGFLRSKYQNLTIERRKL